MKNSIIVRFTDYAVQPNGLRKDQDAGIQRVIGFVEARYLMPLFDELGLDANPRSSKVGNVTSEILETLATTPELFHYKSKGILLGSARYAALDRGRFRLRFEDPETEGILDGGHNMLALGLHILRPYMAENDWKRIKYWDDMKAAWEEHRDEIEDAKSDLTFLVPVELLVPASLDEDDVDAFLMPLLDICAARNNNAQLTVEAKSNKRGFYDEIKDRVPSAFAKRVEWRANTWEDDTEKKPIKVRDLIAQAWLPFNRLNEEGGLPIDISVSAQNIYRNKGECSVKFDDLMRNPEVTRRNGSQYELFNEGVASAFAILADLPRLYDDIYAGLPDAYNSHNLRFGANPIVKIYNPDRRRELKEQGKDIKGYTTSQPYTPFYRETVAYNYPEGLIAPLFYGLKGLMEVKDGKVVWAVGDPRAFVREHLSSIVGSYKLVLDMGKWDPQKIAKNPASHEFAVKEFHSALAQERVRATFAA